MNLPFQDLLHDPDVTDILIRSPERVFYEKNGSLLDRSMSWSSEALQQWIIQSLTEAGKAWDARYPFVDLVLSIGHRAHVVFPPISPDGPQISIRRIARSGESPVWSQDPYFPFLKKIVQARESLILSGATGSGKTRLLNELIESIPAQERILALEDTPELHPQHPHFVRLLTRTANADRQGEVRLMDLLRQSLRMRPDRIILGECRGEEVLELLQALNTGHRGAIVTLHANSAREALKRIELLCMLSGRPIPWPAIRELLALGIRYLCQVVRGSDECRTRKIQEIWEIQGREGDTILLRPVLQGDQ